METAFIICVACILLIPGLLLTLLNWCNIGFWVWEKWRKPRKWVETCIVPFLGGMFLAAAISILVMGLPEYSTPLLKDLAGVLGVEGAAAVVPLAGLLIDYGSIPNLIITPLLEFLFGLKEAPGRATPRGPYCREIQLPFPLILMGEDEIPQLICSPAELPRMDADFLQEAPGSTLYSEGLCQRIVRVHTQHKPTFWNRLRHRNDVDFWAAEVEYTTARPCKPEKLIRQMARLVRQDDDVWTQFHEAKDLLRLLKSCTGFTDLLALGGLAGWWENTTAANGIPGLKEDDLSEDNVRQAAAGIQFTR